MIYLFLSDEAFAVAGTGSVLKYADISSAKLGMLDDNLLNYFVDHTLLNDPVGTNDYINRSFRLHVDEGTALHSVPTGRMYLHFESNLDFLPKETKDYKFIETLTITSGDGNDTDSYRQKVKLRASLFNIIETIFFAHKSESLAFSLLKTDELNRKFADAAGDTYTGYVPNSLQVSSTVTRAAYRYCDTDTQERSVTSNIIDFYDFAIFKFRFSDSPSDIVELKVWLNPDSFKRNYPFSTITDIIYPCKPTWLYNPADSGGQVEAVINASLYKDMALDHAVTSRDHSGISIYTSRYVNVGVSSNARIGFVVMYKGASPSTKTMQNAIRQQLLAENIASENEWKSILPDLFVDASFYIIPCYFQRKAYSGGTQIEQSIVPYRVLYDKLHQLFPDYDTQDLFDYMEILQAPGHNLYLAAIPADITHQTYTSILAIHPTYQSIDSLGIAYNYRRTSDKVYSDNKVYYYRNENDELYEYTVFTPTPEQYGQTIDKELYERVTIHVGYWNTMTNKTKEFTQLLSNCLTVCLDETSSHVIDFTKEEINTAGHVRVFYTFVSNSIEYKLISLRDSHDILSTSEQVREECEHVAGYIH